MKRLYIRMAVALAAVLLAIAFGDAFLSKVSVQRGYDGTGMVLEVTRQTMADEAGSATVARSARPRTSSCGSAVAPRTSGPPSSSG